MKFVRIAGAATVLLLVIAHTGITQTAGDPIRRESAGEIAPKAEGVQHNTVPEKKQIEYSLVLLPSLATTNASAGELTPSTPITLAAASGGDHLLKIATIAVSIASSLLSGSIAVWILFQNKREKRSERLTDQVGQVEVFWMQKLVFEPHFKTILEFFQDCDSDLTEYVQLCSNVKGAKALQTLNVAAEEKVERFTDRYDVISGNVVEPLHMIDERFGKQLMPLLDEIQEEFTGYLDKRTFKSGFDPSEAMRKRKLEFANALFNTQREVIKSREISRQAA